MKAHAAKAPRHATCSVLGRCGGCDQQDEYESQLRRKRAAIRRALEKVVKPDQVAPVKGLSHPFGYRTKLLMPAAPGKVGAGPLLGFYEKQSTRLVEAIGCPVQHPLTLAAATMVRQVLAGSPVRASRPKSREGWLHGINIRVEPTTGDWELILCGRTPKVPGEKGLIPRLAALPKITGIHLTAQKQRSSYLLGEEFKHLAGRRRTVFYLHGEAFHLSPGAFFQTSHEGAHILGDIVRDLAPERCEHFADLYGGVGVFTRLLQGRWKRAVITELGGAAVADAKAWVKATSQPRVRVVPGRVEQTIDRTLDGEPDFAVVDPPRSGCHHAVIKALANRGPQTLIYVACGLDALAKDAEGLVEGGYTIDTVEAVDMFPNTSHVETVARFVRR